MTLLEWIEQLARSALPGIREDGCATAGHNGPYLHPETSVRNTGHWLITFSRLYRATDDPAFLEGARLCGDYLLSPAARPRGYTFHHRDAPGRDRCNGLMGQAWSIEALAEAATLLDDPRFTDVAEEVFLLHDYHEGAGLWYRREIDGASLSADPTFNHQLWFAAAGALLPSKAVAARVRGFLDHLDENVVLYHSGLIWHPIPRRAVRTLASATLFGPLAWVQAARLRLRDAWKRVGKRDPEGSEMYWKCVGYHAFNTYAFSMLRSELPDHRCWESRTVRALTGFLETDEYRSQLAKEDTYGYGYNPPGYEVPFSLHGLTDLTTAELVERTVEWMRRQLDRTWDPTTSGFRQDVADPVTLAARVYELARIPPAVLRSAGFPGPAGE